MRTQIDVCIFFSDCINTKLINLYIKQNFYGPSKNTLSRPILHFNPKNPYKFLKEIRQKRGILLKLILSFFFYMKNDF